jgi:hypothetical protein
MPLPAAAVTGNYKKIAFFFLTTILSLESFSVLAQKSGVTQSFGIGLEMGVSPTVQTTQFFNFGLTARYSLHAGPGFVYIGTGFMISREALDFQIPIRGGYKFVFEKKYFITGELGYYIDKAPTLSESESHTITGLAVAPSVGIQFGLFDLSARYCAAINDANASTIGLALTWNF